MSSPDFILLGSVMEVPVGSMKKFIFNGKEILVSITTDIFLQLITSALILVGIFRKEHWKVMF